MLDKKHTFRVGPVDRVIGPLLTLLGRAGENALFDRNPGDPARRILARRLDLAAEVDGVGEQSVLVRLQVGDAGVAGVDASVKYCDWPLHQADAGRVLE